MPSIDTSNESDRGISPLQRISRYASLVVTVVLLAALLYSFEDYAIFRHVELSWLSLALVISICLNTYIGAFKWHSVMRLSGVELPWSTVWRTWSGLHAAGFFMPFQSSSLLYILALRRFHRVQTGQAIECVVYDRYLSLIGMVALVGAGQVLLPADHPFARWWIGVLCAAVVVAYFLDTQVLRILKRIEFTRRHLHMVRTPAAVATKVRLLLLAVLYQSSDVVTFFVACLALGLDVAPAIVLGVFPLVTLISLVPVTFSGLGVREALTALMFAGSVTWDQGIAAGLVVDFVEYIAPALFGLFWLNRLLRNRSTGSS